MNNVGVDALQSVVEKLQNAAETLGVNAIDIARTYDPQADAENLVEGETIVRVWLQDINIEGETEDQGTEKAVKISVGMLTGISDKSAETLDPLVNRFEDLLNLIVSWQEPWETDAGNRFCCTEAESIDILNPNVLKEGGAVISRLDLTLLTYSL